MSDKLISVVVCTYKRADYLALALNGLLAQTLDAGRYEVIVVDNGIETEVKQMVERHAGDPSPPQYLKEPCLGLSHARNAGWKRASGQFVAYLDDDAIPLPNWLLNAAELISTASKNLGMFGGRVQPIWESPRPKWLTDEYANYLSVVDLGDETKPVDSITGIVGANMFIRRSLLAEVGGFSEALGRKGKSLLSNEELQLKRDIGKAGYEALYCAGIEVWHHVPSNRLRRSWFLRRLYWQGRSDAQMERLQGVLSRSQLKRKGRSYLREALREMRYGARSYIKGRGALASLTKAAYLIGFATETAG